MMFLYSNSQQKIIIRPSCNAFIFIEQIVIDKKSNLMGQTSTNGDNQMICGQQRQWKAHPMQKDIFCHCKSKLQVRKFFTRSNKKTKQILKKRMKDHHPYIIRIMHYEPSIIKFDNQSKQQGFNVYVERVFKVTKKDWKPTQTTLSLLKGFRRLSSFYGPFRIQKSLIGINGQNEIRLWINENPIKNEPQAWVISEKEMIQTLGKIITEFDSQTAILLVGAESFNESINNILVDMSKKSTHCTQRHNISKQNSHNIINQKNKFLQPILRKRKAKPFIQPQKEGNQASHIFKKALVSENISVKTAAFSKSTPGNFDEEGIFDQLNDEKPFFNENIERNQKYIPQQSYSIYGNDLTKKKVKGRNRHSSNDLTGQNSNSDFSKRFQTQNVDNFYRSMSPSPQHRKISQKDDLDENINQRAIIQMKINPPMKSGFEEVCQFDNAKILKKNLEEKYERSDKNNKQSNQNLESKGKDQKAKKFLSINMKKVIQDPLEEKQDRKSESNSQKQHQSTKEDQEQSTKLLKQNFSKKIKQELGELLSVPDVEVARENISKGKDLLIKQKISRKKQTFAELKKEALKLLKNQISL